MLRHAALKIVLVGLTLSLVLFSTAAQSNQNSSVPPRPNEGALIGGPDAQTSSAPLPSLQCQNCHGPGRELPYMGGSQFHTAQHTGYSHSFHAQALQNGGKAASCLDCHARNHDMTTMLSASDPASPINRANIAATCGRCHGDQSVMKGSGISNQVFLSYRESVHAKAMARGNMSAAVCTDCHTAHDILPASNAQSSIAKVNIPATCGKCHSAEADEFMQSVQA